MFNRHTVFVLLLSVLLWAAGPQGAIGDSPASPAAASETSPRAVLMHEYLAGNAKFPQMNVAIRLRLFKLLFSGGVPATELFTPPTEDDMQKIQHAMNQLHKAHGVAQRTPDAEDARPGAIVTRTRLLRLLGAFFPATGRNGRALLDYLALRKQTTEQYSAWVQQQAQGNRDVVPGGLAAWLLVRVLQGGAAPERAEELHAIGAALKDLFESKEMTRMSRDYIAFQKTHLGTEGANDRRAMARQCTDEVRKRALAAIARALPSFPAEDHARILTILVPDDN